MRNQKTKLRAGHNLPASSEKRHHPSTGARRNPAPQPERAGVQVGVKAAQIVRSAIDELRELAQSEKQRYPRVTCLANAVRRASSKISLELVSLGLVYPLCMVILAAVAIGWFYLSAHLEGTQ